MINNIKVLIHGTHKLGTLLPFKGSDKKNIECSTKRKPIPQTKIEYDSYHK